MKNTSAENYITILLLNRNNPAVCRKYARKGHVLFALRTGNMNLDTKNLSLETISWSFFPFQVSPVPHQQEITDSSRGRSFTVFGGGGDTLQRQVYGRRWKAFTKGNKGELVTVSTLFMLL